MGKVIDPNMIENLFSETMNYRKKVESIADEIHQQVFILNNPQVLDGMRGGQGDTAIAAIKQVVKASQDLVARAKAICKFIDSKLDALNVLRKNTAGFSEAQNMAKNATAAIKK